MATTTYQRRTRKDKRWETPADCNRAYRQRMKQQQETINQMAAFAARIAFARRQRAIHNPRKFGEVFQLTDAEILQEIEQEYLDDIPQPGTGAQSKKASESAKNAL